MGVGLCCGCVDGGCGGGDGVDDSGGFRNSGSACVRSCSEKVVIVATGVGGIMT